MTTIEQLDEEVSAMLTVDRRTPDGSVLGRVALDPAVFGVTPHVPVMHQVVRAQLAARRAGTQSTRTRAEVSGGGSKPFRQKGTGRARQGSTRAPHWSGGGVALGPKPRSYKQRTPKRMVQLALRSALSDRAMEGKVSVISEWGFGLPKTKEAAAALRALELSGRILVVLAGDDVMAERSFDNIPYVDLVEDVQLTAYDVLCSDHVVFTDATLPGETATVETYDPPKPPPTRDEPEHHAPPTRKRHVEATDELEATVEAIEEAAAEDEEEAAAEDAEAPTTAEAATTVEDETASEAEAGTPKAATKAKSKKTETTKEPESDDDSEAVSKTASEATAEAGAHAGEGEDAPAEEEGEK
jgi:large subunit ribosomal protein L4